MLPPNELKNKKFSKAVRGYSMIEVDEHIEFIIEKYTELYRENDDLERKLRVTLAKLDVIKKDEESIRSALINAQRASSTIINEANERAEVIMRATKTNCDKILSDFRADIRAERDRFIKLRAIVSEFKKELFNIYNTHIEYIDTINPDTVDIEDLKISEEVLVRRAITEIKKDIADNIEHKTKQETASVQSEPQAGLSEKNAVVSGQLATPPAIPEVDEKKSQATQLNEPAEAKKTSDIINEVKNAPVSEDFAPENIAGSQSEIKNEFKPAEDLNTKEESDSEIEFDYEEESVTEEEYESEDISEPEFESEELTFDEEIEEESEPERKAPAFVRGPVTVPKNIQKKGSVKDTIRELNKIFNTAGNVTEEYFQDEDKTGNSMLNIADDDDFGAEEFDDYNPVESVKSPKPQDNDAGEDESEIESDEDREYREFIKSIEDAAGNRENNKISKKQKKNKPKQVTKDGKDFDFI